MPHEKQVEADCWSLVVEKMGSEWMLKLRFEMNFPARMLQKISVEADVWSVMVEEVGLECMLKLRSLKIPLRK